MSPIDSFHISKTILIKLIKAMQRRMTLHPVALRAPRFVLKSTEKAPEVCVKDQLETEWSPVIIYNVHSAKRSFTLCAFGENQW